jgi:hypothetical protein
VIGHRRTVGLLSLALLPACAGHLPPCPAAGGPAWTELESAHFRLRTDEDATAGRAAITDLEQFQAALLTAIGAPPDLDTGKVPVVIVEGGWTDFAPRQLRGFFTTALFQPLIVMIAGSEVRRQDTIKHELVHYLSNKIMPHQLPWLAEGLATYYETIEYDAHVGLITVGRPSPGRLRWAQRTSAATLERLFTATAIDGGDEDMARFYAAAWITVHYLMNHRQEALLAYEKALRTRASPEAAWTAAFGAQTPAQLAGDVRRYIDRGRYAMLTYRFPGLQLATPVERRLTDPDTHATRALLYLIGDRMRGFARAGSADGGDPKQHAQRELDEALRQEPTHVRSRAIARFMLGTPVDVEQAIAGSRTHGDDWIAWMLLAEARQAQDDGAGIREAIGRMLEIARADRSIELTVEWRTRPAGPSP